MRSAMTKSGLLGVASAAGILSAAAGAAAQAPWTLVVIPDTQFYSDNAARFPQFTDQTSWIVASLARMNIAFVSHIGDIVQNGANGGNNVEWNRADQAMDLLDGVVPYAACIGNHDYNTVSSKGSGSSSYGAFFGPARYAGYPWYGGASANGQNHFQRFTAGGREYLHLALEWQPNAAAYAWAQGVLDANPGLPTIVSTHEHIIDANTAGTGAGRSAAGTLTWNSLVRNNPRIFLVVNGHFHQGNNGFDGEHYLDSRNDSGTQVFEMLGDYQDWTNGGSGYLRVLGFDERNNLIRVRTFSPTLDRFEIDANSTITFAMDFDARFGPARGTPALQTLFFQQGVNGYASMIDTEVAGARPAVDQSVNIGVTVDGNDGGLFTNGLVRFDDVFGGAPGQVAPGSDIILAKLRIEVINPGSGFSLHTMLAPWAESATWNSLVNGVSADGIEALAAAETFAGGNNGNANVPSGFLEMDVTASLRAAFNGAAFNGWAMIPFALGSNGVDFNTSEFATVALRPSLTIITPSEPVSVMTFREGLNGYAGTRDVELRQVDPAVADGGAASMTIDADEPNGSGNDTQVLIRFEDLFGPGAGRIPSNADVTSAMLVLNVADEGSGMTLHRVLADWDEASTWNSTVGGISADDVEAQIWADARGGVDSASASLRAGAAYFDVTESVQAFIGGEVNRGWVLRPFASANNGIDVASSENVLEASRPTLIVRYIAPPAPPTCLGDADGDLDRDFSDITSVLANFGQNGNPFIPGDANGDGSVDFSDITSVLANFGLACN